MIRERIGWYRRCVIKVDRFPRCLSFNANGVNKQVPNGTKEQVDMYRLLFAFVESTDKLFRCGEERVLDQCL